MEIKTEMSTIQVDMQCDECGKGNMRPTGRVFLTHPAQFQHQCDACHVWGTYQHQYPYIKHAPIDGVDTDIVP